MTNTDNWEDLLTIYSESPKDLRGLVAELSNHELALVPDPENWSIREIVHHIIDADSIWTSFIKQALGEQERPFELFWYWDLTQDEWGHKWAYGTRPVEPGLVLIQANHDYLVSILSSVVDPASISLEIPWPGGEIGSWTIRDALEWNLKHTKTHLDDINQILTNLT